ncbi:uncharacterized protein TM35_000172220, partial [Trypanosoma theileri]
MKKATQKQRKLQNSHKELILGSQILLPTPNEYLRERIHPIPPIESKITGSWEPTKDNPELTREEETALARFRTGASYRYGWLLRKIQTHIPLDVAGVILNKSTCQNPLFQLAKNDRTM